MARVHTRKRGRCKRSRKHYPRTVPKWFDMDTSEVEEMAAKLAREGVEPAQIGVILRDTYAVPDVKVITGKKLSKILADKGIVQEYPPDLLNLIKRAVRLRKHLSVNKSDILNKDKLNKIESKIRRLAKYYNETGRLKNWSYDPQQVAQLVR
ncbi:MAG: 30S ribosomal protein S15 [Candidatus Micrarchaeia archaeon]